MKHTKKLILIAALAASSSLKADDDWQTIYYIQEQTRAIERQTELMKRAQRDTAADYYAERYYRHQGYSREQMEILLEALED